MFHGMKMRGCGPRGHHGMHAMRARGRHGWAPERGEGEGRGRRRMFDGGELRLVLLNLIAEQPRHGYDLIREIEERTGGAYAPSPGVIYPTLTLLQDMGLIEEAKGEGARKLFAITEAGKAHLAEHAEEAQALLGRLAELGSMRAKTDGVPIRRAMVNLRTVIQHRLSRDDVDADTLHDVAALLDEVAQKIERL